ncbi:MAG: CsgG/HfaB family protein [Planctomycetota bacterium]
MLLRTLPLLFVSLSLIGCASSLNRREVNVAMAKAPEKDLRVAVLDFETKEGKEYNDGLTNFKPDANAGPRLAEVVATKLVGLPKHVLIERSRLEEVRKELELQQEDLVGENLKKLGKLAGADAIVLGSAEGTYLNNAFGWANQLRASFRLVDIEAGSVLWSVDGHIYDTNSSSDVYVMLTLDAFGQLKSKIEKDAKKE